MPTSFNRSTQYQLATTYYDYNPYLGTLDGVSTSYATDTEISEQRTFVGSRNTNYRSFRKTHGYLPTLGALDTYIRYDGVPVLQRQWATVGAGSGNPRLVVKYEREIRSVISITTPPSVPSSLVDEAWSRVRQKVLAQDFNAPVFIAEGGKTVQHLAHTATRLFKAMRAFRKGQFRQMAKALGISVEGAPRAWLEYKYGWMPLLLDIHGSAKTLAEHSFRRDLRVFKSRISRASTYQGTNPVVHGTLTHTAMAWVTVRTRFPNIVTANQLGLLNPATIAWEVIPFSFVADWFVNIGDFLAELTAWQGLDIVDGGSFTRVDLQGLAEENNFFPWDKPAECKVTYRSFSRSSGVQTMPRLMIKSDPLNLSRLTTAASLLSGEARRTEWGRFRFPGRK